MRVDETVPEAENRVADLVEGAAAARIFRDRDPALYKSPQRQRSQQTACGAGGKTGAVADFLQLPLGISYG